MGTDHVSEKENRKGAGAEFKIPEVPF